MKTLVIHPKDPTTDFLSKTYKDHPEWAVLRDNLSHAALKLMIKDHDRIIMLGHGDQYGLYGHDRYMIDSTLVYLLREKSVVCIWCNADVFFVKYELSGFTTGMIVSEYLEAILYCVEGEQEDIDESNELFGWALQCSIDSYDMLKTIQDIYNKPDNPIITWNRRNLFKNKHTYSELLEKYNTKHKYCPKCGASGHSTTLMACLMDMSRPEAHVDSNHCNCSECGDSHITHDRISLEEAEKIKNGKY